MADGSRFSPESVDDFLADATFYYANRLWYKSAKVTSSGDALVFETDRRMPEEVMAAHEKYLIRKA